MAATLAFVYKAETRFGQSVRVVGNCPKLGNWDPAKAPALTTDPSKYPMWFGSIQCQAPVEYKFVIFDELQGAVWEEGPNRYFAFTDDGEGAQSGDSGESFPVENPHGSKEDPAVVKAALQENMQVAVPIPTPKVAGMAGEDALRFRLRHSFAQSLT